VIELARRALVQQLAQQPVFDAPAKVKHYLQLQLGARPFEVFAVMFLDAQNRLLKLEEMFRGTLTQTSVYPARGRQARARAARRRGNPRAQPPLGCGRAVARRRVSDADAEERPGAGRRARARSPGRRPHEVVSFAERACCDEAAAKARALAARTLAELGPLKQALQDAQRRRHAAAERERERLAREQHERDLFGWQSARSCRCAWSRVRRAVRLRRQARASASATKRL